MCALLAVAGRGRADPVPPDRLHVLIINGGADPRQNYQSHLLHVRELVTLLGRGGLSPEQIAIFSGDGADPTEDLAVRELAEPDFWLLRGTKLERPLGPPTLHANSTVSGIELRAATPDVVRTWFAEARGRLVAGDTLLLYVTDHGTKNPKDSSNNEIVLWGARQALSVDELRDLLVLLDPGVRVVALMSQCFSGAFARIATVGASDGIPRGNVCGYFASTAERPAYGCYPENRGRDNVGHSFHFFQALEVSRRLPDAHDAVLVIDRTPDVPNRSSDGWLDGLLATAASVAKEEEKVLVDRLLATAWRDKAAWEPDIRLLDRVAHAFGVFSPRSLEELDRQTEALPEVRRELKAHETAWDNASDALAGANLDRFLAARPLWAPLATGAIGSSVDPTAARTLTAELLPDLDAFTRADEATSRRLHMLRDQRGIAAEVSYRMEVRLAAELRLRALLRSIAGRVLLAERGTPAERKAYEALQACEDLQLDLPETAATVPAPAPFPSYEEDVRLAQSVVPGWMGINFRQATEKHRTDFGLAEGAAGVLNVYPDSPAREAGLETGDIVVGPPGGPFTEPHQIREWVMLAKVDEPALLEVVREGAWRRVTLTPKPYPRKWPKLPGPPAKGTPAPPLSLGAYRGTPPTSLADGTPHLLFFWATWCAPCKLSVPEVLAFEQTRGTPVVAISDEPAKDLDRFFEKRVEPFPETVAIDEYRRAFQAFAVSGTPTFVLVDAAGVVQHAWTGYALNKGLQVEGWSWRTAAKQDEAP